MTVQLKQGQSVNLRTGEVEDAEEAGVTVMVQLTYDPDAPAVEYAYVPNGDPARVAAFVAEALMVAHYVPFTVKDGAQ